MLVQDSCFLTRGVVLYTSDLATLDWPRRAAAARLTTIATHMLPSQVTEWLATGTGEQFLADCASYGLAVEHELHAMGELLPRELFTYDPALFRMDEEGLRTPQGNLCPSNPAALELVSERAQYFTGLLPSTTGRYFYWLDDGLPMCRCPRCRELADSDQAVLVENTLLSAIREVAPQATLAHLAYHNTLQAPTQVRPDKGLFLEFAPIHRRYDVSLVDLPARLEGQLSHGEQLEALKANLEWFGAEGAQAIEYWLDISRFSGWDRNKVSALDWRPDVLRADLALYAQLGVRHITSFAPWLDGDYVARFGEPPLGDYGAALLAAED